VVFGEFNCLRKGNNKTTFQKNVGQSNGKPRLDLNVEKAWAMGYTGKNITTAIMDDGVDYMHPDLKNNFNAEASYDFSSNDPYPYPRYSGWLLANTFQNQ
jgi:proprotein convertase subtilisin/kexin type 2